MARELKFISCLVFNLIQTGGTRRKESAKNGRSQCEMHEKKSFTLQFLRKFKLAGNKLTTPPPPHTHTHTHKQSYTMS